MNRTINHPAAWRAAYRVRTAWQVTTRHASVIRQWLLAYWPGRRTALLTLGMTFLFLFAGASAASAADNSERGGILAPLNVMSSEGVPLDNYELLSDNGGATDIRSHVCNLLLGADFALVRMVVGLMCWLLKWIFNFPIVSTLTQTATDLASRFYLLTADELGLYDLFLAGAFAFGLILVMRGKFARGFGEIALTLLLCTVVLLPALSPKAILGPQGPLAQSQQAAHEVGQMTANINGVDPGCTSAEDKKDPSCPMRVILTRTLVVQPYQLLQYGAIFDPKSDNPRIRELAEVHHKWITREIHGKSVEEQPCNGQQWLGVPCDPTSGFDELKAELKKHGDEGKAAYGFAVNSNWDRVGGTFLVLAAALLVAMVVITMALVHLGCQFADVIAATCTPVALIWAMLPGGNRAALWRWLGVFMAGTVTEFAASALLPLFGLGADSILTSSQGTVMVQRMILLVSFALVILVFHRRIFAAAGRIGERFAARMRYAKIGGSSMAGDDSRLGLAMSQAMGGLASGGGAYGGYGLGGGLFGGGSPAHAALMRRSRIAQGLVVLGDPGLGPMSAGAMTAGAFGEVSRGWAALSLPIRAAHHLVVGNPLPEHKLARRRKPVGGNGPVVVHGKTGQILHDPKNETTPIGYRIHNRLLNTRIGRIAIAAGKVGKFGFDATVGLPASWERINKANDRMWEGVNEQWEHYSNVAKDWWGDEKAGVKDIFGVYNATKDTYNAVKGGYNHVHHRAATMGEVYGPYLVDGMHIAYGSTLGRMVDTYDGTHVSPESAAHGNVWEHARDRSPEYPFFETGPTPEAEPSDSLIQHHRPASTSPTELDLPLGPGVVRPAQPAQVVPDSGGMVVNPVTGEVLSDPGEAAAANIGRRVSDAARQQPDPQSLEAARFRNAEPAILGPVLRDDGEVLVVQQRAAHGGLSLTHVTGASLPDDGPGHEQADGAVDRPTVPGDLRVGVLGPDLVAEEVRRLAGGVGDQGFGFGQFQL